jgi:hypothetical protein
VHGLRYPVLPHGVPAREPHSRVERSRVPRPLARRDRTAARDEQLSGVHRPLVPGAVRSGLRARYQRARGHDQAGRSRDHRPCVGRRMGRADRPVGAHGQARRRRRERAERSGRGAAVDARGPRGRRVRARRPDRRAAAVRHSRVQDGEAPPRPAHRTDGSGRHRVPHRRERRRQRSRRGGPRVRRGGARGWRHCLARPPGARARVRRDLPGDGVPAGGQPGAGRRPHRTAVDRRRQARRHHRRGRHGCRLPGHVDPAGRGERAPKRCRGRPTR